MSGTSGNSGRQRQPREVRTRIMVNVCAEEPKKTWNDLWVRIFAEFDFAYAEGTGSTHENNAENNAENNDKHRDEDEVRGRMERG